MVNKILRKKTKQEIKTAFSIKYDISPDDIDKFLKLMKPSLSLRISKNTIHSILFFSSGFFFLFFLIIGIAHPKYFPIIFKDPKLTYEVYTNVFLGILIFGTTIILFIKNAIKLF